MEIKNTEHIVRIPFSPSGARGAQQGSVVITIVLFMIILMTSAAVVLSGTLSRHVRASQDYLASEKAFAGADTGIEAMRYYVTKTSPGGDIPDDFVVEPVEYDGSNVEIRGGGCARENSSISVQHLTASGTFGSLVRRIEVSGGEGECE